MTAREQLGVVGASSIPDLIRELARICGEETALVQGDRLLNFAELEEAVSALGRDIRAVANREGKPSYPRVGIVLPNGISLAVALLAASSVGVAVPLNPGFKRDEYDEYMQKTRIDVLISDSRVEVAVQAAHSLEISILHLLPTWRVIGAGHLAAPTPSRAPWGDDVALVLLTSGSSGRKKVVPLTHSNLLAGARNVADSVQLGPGDQCLSMWNQYHIGGVVDLLLAPLLAKSSVLFESDFSAPAFLSHAKSGVITWTQFVPATLREVIREAPKAIKSLPTASLRFVRCVAAPLRPEDKMEAQATLGVPVVETFGMTEAGPLITSTELSIEGSPSGSVGKPVGDIEISVGPTRGSEAGHQNRSGEIYVRGSSVFSGYDPPDQLEAEVKNEWFKTGDIGFIDDAGNLFLEGRSKDVINRGGEKVNPTEVDGLLKTLPNVLDAACFPIEHPTLGEDLCAFVQLVEGAELEEEIFRTQLLEQVIPYKVPSRFVLVGSIPRNDMGKISRPDLARIYAETRSGPVTSGAKIEQDVLSVAVKLAQIWARELEVHHVGFGDDFSSLGGDSLSSLRIAVAAEATFKLHIPEDVLPRFTTVQKMAEWIIEHSLEFRGDEQGSIVSTQVGRLEARDNLRGPGWYRRRIVRSRGLDSKRLREDAQIHLTPHEMRKMVSALRPENLLLYAAGSRTLRKWLARIRRELSRKGPWTAWKRYPVGDFVTLYRRGSRAQRLVIVFTGSALRIFMPVYRFLRRITPGETDFLVVFDPRFAHYEDGVPGLGDNIVEIASSLNELALGLGYDKISAIGTSAGCLPALAAAREMGWDAVSLMGPDRIDFDQKVGAVLRRQAESNSRLKDVRLLSSSRPRDVIACEQILELFTGVEVRIDFSSIDHNVVRHLAKGEDDDDDDDLFEWVMDV